MRNTLIQWDPDVEKNFKIVFVNFAFILGLLSSCAPLPTPSSLVAPTPPSYALFLDPLVESSTTEPLQNDHPSSREAFIESRGGEQAITDERPMIAGFKPLSFSPAETSASSSLLWEKLKDRFSLPHYESDPRVSRFIKLYTQHPARFEHRLKKASPYLHFIAEEVRKRHLPAEIVLIPIVESDFDPFVLSVHGAAGLWQIIPGTGKDWGLTQNAWYDGRKDIVASTKAALDYLQYLHRFFKGDWLHVIAAYNCGEGKVLRAIKANQRLNKSTHFWALALPKETREFVPRILALAGILQHPANYQITLPALADKPYLASVSLYQQTSLNHIAKWTGLPFETVRQYNPGFSKSITPPQGPHQILLPVTHVQKLLTQVAAANQKKNSSPPKTGKKWQPHYVRSGETLTQLAKTYKTNVNTLKNKNPLPSYDKLPVGHKLWVPVDQTYS